MKRRLRIGTRGSQLALWQANYVLDELVRKHSVEAELVRIKTVGDQMQTASVAQALENAPIGAESAKGIFTKEVEDALLAGTVDIGVHSMKDVPTETPAGLAFAAITRREDPRDCLISRTNRSLKYLSSGARIGTSSIRRKAQLRHLRLDVQLLDMRGNVDTRLRKVAEGEYDAIVLAIAGINRLGMNDRVTQVLNPEVMLPAVGQGALGVETRADDPEVANLVASLDHAETRACVTAERAVLRELEGGCQVPLGAWAKFAQDGQIDIEAGVFSPDGEEAIRHNDRGPVHEAEAIGKRLAQTLIEAGADRILRLTGRTVG